MLKRIGLLIAFLGIAFNIAGSRRVMAAEIGAAASAVYKIYAFVAEAEAQKNAAEEEKKKLKQIISAVVSVGNIVTKKIQNDRMEKFFGRALGKLGAYELYLDDAQKKRENLTNLAIGLRELLGEIRHYVECEDGTYGLYLTTPYFALHSIEVLIEEQIIKRELRPEERQYDKILAIIESGLEMHNIFRAKYAKVFEGLCTHTDSEIIELGIGRQMTSKEKGDGKFVSRCWAQYCRPYRKERRDALAEVGEYDCRFPHPRTTSQLRFYKDLFEMSKAAFKRLTGKKATYSMVDGNSLRAGQVLAAGETLRSKNGEFRLTMQGDGNLVLYKTDGTPIWSSKTVHTQSNRAVVQSDGNFVVYADDGKATWASGRFAESDIFLILQSDGNLCVYGDGECIWDRG